jgi:Manganese containing catalase
MYHHVKKLMFTVRVDEPDPRFGNMLLEQFGGANGELAAAMQYSIQGLNCEDPDRKDLMMDIGTEELSHPQHTRSRVPMTRRFRHSFPQLSSVSRCLGPTQVVTPFHHLSGDSHHHDPLLGPLRHLELERGPEAEHGCVFERPTRQRPGG